MWFRTLLYARKFWKRPRLDLLGTSVLHFTVLPSDLDQNLHVNNGRYLAFMDLGRVDLLLCSPLGRPIVRGRWAPVVGSLLVQYRQSLRPFQKFRLETRILGWEGRWFYLEQRFYRGSELVTDAVVKALLTSRGSLPAQEIAEKAGHSAPSPFLDPALVARFKLR